MSTPPPRLLDRLPPVGSDPSDVIDGYSAWAAETGRPLYPHQEDAALALASGSHVVLATPTGSGKSMAAIAGIALARNVGRRSVWTAPIKALVAEKFFELVDLLGASEVGLAIGDASINRDAPVLVCTAEVFANLALGDAFLHDAAPGFACLDEFHYYGDTDRGWAWQVPLLLPNDTQFLLASATLGDVSPIIADLEARTSTPVENITSVNRPIPLYPEWRATPLAESIVDAVERGRYPVYLVHSTQAAAVEQAQSLVSLPLTTREQREAIAAAVKGERLTTGFGQTHARHLRMASACITPGCSPATAVSSNGSPAKGCWPLSNDSYGATRSLHAQPRRARPARLGLSQRSLCQPELDPPTARYRLSRSREVARSRHCISARLRAVSGGAAVRRLRAGARRLDLPRDPRLCDVS